MVVSAGPIGAASMVIVGRAGRIPAPVEQVWTMVGRVEALPAWLAGLRQVVATGPDGLGRRLTLTGSRTGDGLDRQAEIIAWQPPTLLAWRYVAAGRPDLGWSPTRPDELHIQLSPDRQDSRIQLYAVAPAGLIGGLALRLGAARRWREELARSVAALHDRYALQT